jgi:hypothetical protein
MADGGCVNNGTSAVPLFVIHDMNVKKPTMQSNPRFDIRHPFRMAGLLLKTPAVLIIVGLSAVAPAEAATKVFLLAGQSNMAGVGQYPGGVINGQTIPPEPAIAHPYDDPQPDVKFWYNNAWTALRPGFGYQTGEFGPEVTFGYRLNQLFPDDDIYLVKYAESGSNLAVDWKPDGTGPQYNAFKSRVNAALQNLNDAHLNPEVAGMIWMQGESDANKHDFAVNYATNLAVFINKVRLDFGAANMRFVIGQIDNWAWGATADCDLVRTAQQTVAEADGNAAWFNTDNLQRVYTGHYGTQGQTDLGILFANKFAVPEPSTLILLAAGLVGLLVHAWRKRN